MKNLHIVLRKALVCFSMLLFLGLSYSFAQTTPKEAVDIIDTELSDIQEYFQDKFPQFPFIKAYQLDQSDWYQVNHINALHAMKGLLLDGNDQEMAQDVVQASKLGFPTAATENGMFYAAENDSNSQENHNYLEQYLSNLLEL